MTEVSIGVLVALGSSPHEPAVLTAVEQGPMHVVRRCVDIADLLATAASRQADIALVGADLPGLNAEIVERIQATAVTVVGVLATTASADEAVLRAQGVEHISTIDDVASLVELVTAIVADRDQRPPTVAALRNVQGVEVVDSSHDGRVIAVWGPTGAPGRSTVAMGVASVLADQGLETMLIDADVYGGSTAVQLGVLDEMSGLLAAARAANAGVLSPEALAAQARTVAPRLRVLTGLPRADRWPEVKAVLMGRIVQTARQLGDSVVVDCGFSLERDEEVMYDTAAPRRNGATVEVLDRADDILLVGVADPVGLSRLVRAAHELASVMPQTRPRIVVNRVRPSLGWSGDDISATLTRALGRVSISYLPDDQEAADRSLVQGTTLAEGSPDSKLTRALDELARDVTGRSSHRGSPPAFRWRRATRGR